MNEEEKQQIELLKLEYQLVAQRYENVYKAVWQIFQYIVALSTAILVFGSANFHLFLATVGAILPLLFWYFTTFVPMNRYGDETEVRLQNIEAILNKLAGFEKISETVKGTGFDFSETTLDGVKRKTDDEVPIALSHYSGFGERYPAEDTHNEIQRRWWFNLYGRRGKPSVRRGVRVLGSFLIFCLILVALASFLPFFAQSDDPSGHVVHIGEGAVATILTGDKANDNARELVVEVESLERHVEALSATLIRLSEQIDANVPLEPTAGEEPCMWLCR